MVVGIVNFLTRLAHLIIVIIEKLNIVRIYTVSHQSFNQPGAVDAAPLRAAPVSARPVAKGRG